MDKKRIYVPTAKPGELKAVWGRAERGDAPDIVYAWGEGVNRADGRMLHNALSGERLRPTMKNLGGYEVDKSFLEELENRGYDLTTLKFSIQKKTP
jgi:hypothetical protein